MKEALGEHEIYFRGVFAVSKFEFEVRLPKNKMADPKWRQLFFDSAELQRKITLSGFFGVAEFELEVIFAKNKMVDPKWRQLFFW